MENKIEKVSVTDLTALLYCPRKLYLTKIIGLKEPPNRKMVLGRLKHQILEDFSRNEESLIKKIDKVYDKLDLSIIYQDFLKALSEKIAFQNKELMDSFGITLQEVIERVTKDFASDLKIRVQNLHEGLKKGLFKEELWSGLPLKYISEIKVESEAYGLRGRVDRIEIIKSTGDLFPYELKTRDEKIYYSDELQLAAYAMLLEDLYKKKINIGFVESGNKKEKIEITQEHKDNVIKTAQEVRDLRNNPLPPILSNFSKCKVCSLQEQCYAIK